MYVKRFVVVQVLGVLAFTHASGAYLLQDSGSDVSYAVTAFAQGLQGPLYESRGTLLPDLMPTVTAYGSSTKALASVSYSVSSSFAEISTWNYASAGNQSTSYYAGSKTYANGLNFYVMPDLDESIGDVIPAWIHITQTVLPGYTTLGSSYCVAVNNPAGGTCSVFPIIPVGTTSIQVKVGDYIGLFLQTEAVSGYSSTASSGRDLHFEFSLSATPPPDPIPMPFPPVPELGVWTMMMAGLGPLFVAVRLRRRRGSEIASAPAESKLPFTCR